MKNNFKVLNSMKVISYFTVFLFAFSLMQVFAGAPSENKPNQTFHLTIRSATDTIVLMGESDFMATPSSYSINMMEDEGRCVIHMLNFTTPPVPGTYDVENTEALRTAIVCILENAEPRERLASHSGTFTITELTSRFLTGHFDMILKGPISGKEFHITGEVTSENTPTNLRFNTN